MSLLPNTVASGGQIPGDLYFALKSDIPAVQVLSQNGNNVSLSGGGGSVNIAATTSVASSAQKTTAITYDNGFLATTVDGELLIHGRTEVGEPLNPANLSVNGTLEVRGPLEDNNAATGSAAQFLSAGAGGEVIWSTIPGGSGIVAVNAGTNISIPDPGVPVVSVAISSDLDMNGYDIYNASNLTLRSDTGLLKIRSEGTGGANGVAIQTTTAPIVLSTNNEIQLSADGNIGIETSTGLVSISNPTIGNGGAQLNLNGSASIRGDTAQLQVLDGAGVQKGVLSYNSIDGQTHLDGNDLAISAGLGVSLTAGNDDLSLLASIGSVNIESHSNIGISCNSNGVISVGGADTSQVNISTKDGGSLVGINGETVNITGGFLNATLGGSISLITSGTVGITADDPITISTTGNTDVITISSASDLGLSGQVVTISGGAGVGITASDSDVSIASVLSGNVSISAYEALGLSTVNNSIGITSATDTTITAGGAITTTSANVSMTASAGGIELHSNGSNLVLASLADAVTISSGGGDNVSITAGGGGLILTTAGDLFMNGAGIQDTNFGTASGQYLRIKLNGTYYKIQLLDDV